MNRLHIVGRKNSGKTTLITELIQQLTAQGVTVGTVKHTHHRHELDTPGKDSHRHRQAGAAVVGILSPELNAVFYRPATGHDASDRYTPMAPLFRQCDLVLVEGHSRAAAPKVEVWRAASAQPPLARQDSSIMAIITDDPLDVDVPIHPRHDTRSLAAWVRRWSAG